MQDDDLRYLEYLQKELIDSLGFKKHEDFLLWWSNKKKSEMDSAGDTQRAKHLQKIDAALQSFVPKTQYESFFSSFAVQGLLKDILEVDRNGNSPLEGKVVLANAPNSKISPVVRNANPTHMIFVGEGTLSFCNYWAKFYASVVVCYLKSFKAERITKRNVVTLLKDNPELLDHATRLTLYYSLIDTLMGFGKVDVSDEEKLYQAYMLNAMEFFVVAHEFSHCVADEKHNSFVNEGDGHEYLLELFCDSLAASLSYHVGVEKNGSYLRSGAGGVFFFRAYDLCESVKEVISGKSRVSTSHPPISERVKIIHRMMNEKEKNRNNRKASKLCREDVINLMDAVSELVLKRVQDDPKQATSVIIKSTRSIAKQCALFFMNIFK